MAWELRGRCARYIDAAGYSWRQARLRAAPHNSMSTTDFYVSGADRSREKVWAPTCWGSVTMTTESCKNGTIALSRMNFSGHVWHVTIFSLMLTLLWLLYYTYYGWRRGSMVRTSVFDWRTFPAPDLWLTCDHFVGKVSAMGQPTRPIQLSVLSGSVNE